MEPAPLAPPTDARRVTVSFARLPGWLTGFAERHGRLSATRTATEVILLGSDGATAWLRIPFPPLVEPGDDPVAELLAQVARERRVGVLLVRRGGYAAGVFQGTRLVASKVGSSYVQGTTKAGGWSQQRFARRRANQASAAFADAADVAFRVLVPELGRLEALVCGGDRAAVLAVLADPRLARLATLRRGELLAVTDPRLRVLQATPDQFLAVQISLSP